MAINKRIRQPLALILAVFMAGCGAAHDQSASGDGQHTPDTPAQVMTMARRDIALDKSYPAKLRSNRAVVLIARVTGVLEERRFKPGQRVKKGDRLYTIEPETYQATVGQRKADLQSAQAKAYQAQRNVERNNQLVKSNAISQQEAEQTEAKLRVAKASVTQAKAALASAKIDLGYTNVTAPVSGLISLSQVNIGNVVKPGTKLATITPLDPLEVRFQLPQQDAFDLRRQRRRRQAPITAVLQFPNLQGNAATLKGRLDFLGSSVNQQTSTVQAQAVFDNPKNLYLPGQFVRVRLQGLKRYGVLAVPQIAVTQGLLGPQVFTLNKHNVTATTNVKTGEQAGSRLIISRGLTPGDRVIVSDPGAIKAGMTIKPRPYNGHATAVSAQGGQGSPAGQAHNGQRDGAAKTGSAQGRGGG